MSASSMRRSAIIFAPRAARWCRRDDGALLVESPQELGEFRRDLGSYLRQWAARAPSRDFLCERGASGEWKSVTYAQALVGARSVAQWLLDQGMNGNTPVLILSTASIEHGVLALGCILAGVPFSPVSPGLSQNSGAFHRLRQMANLLQPSVVFVQEEVMFAPALTALRGEHRLTCVSAEPMPGSASLSFHTLLATEASEQVEEQADQITGDTVVKYLFTSGSTGAPKAVPNTHRMLCSNQKMMELLVQEDPEQPPVFVDWLPWSHTFGGNVTFHWILRSGGTLCLDAGKPMPGAFSISLQNVRDVMPTHYFNVPAGYTMLADAMEQDATLCRAFFSRLRFCFYGGASLPQSTWDRIQVLAREYLNEEVLFTTGCGSTETGPIGTFLHWPVQRAGVIGLPAPGVQAKLVPTGERYEMRLRGPNIISGYLRQPEATAKAFDDEGYFCTGDAIRLVNADDPSQGLVFDGRITEDFKLATGTFVQVGNVRIALLSAVRLLRDAVLTASDRPWLGALVWLDNSACESAGLTSASKELGLSAGLRRALVEQLGNYNAEFSGSSQRVCRLYVLLDPPSPNDLEITEKGYVNQKAVLDRRAAAVAIIYAPLEGEWLIDAPADISSLRSC